MENISLKFLKLTTSSNGEYYIFNYSIIKDEEVIGKIVLRNGDNLGFLGNVGIDIVPKYRKHGYAKVALNLLKNIAIMYEEEELIYTCYEENKDSIALASASGFEKIDELDDENQKVYVYKYKLEKEMII